MQKPSNKHLPLTPTSYSYNHEHLFSETHSSSLFGVWTAPGAPETIPKGGGGRSILLPKVFAVRAPSPRPGGSGEGSGWPFSWGDPKGSRSVFLAKWFLGRLGAPRSTNHTFSKTCMVFWLRCPRPPTKTPGPKTMSGSLCWVLEGSVA
jgi:hypothetical protein